MLYAESYGFTCNSLISRVIFDFETEANLWSEWFS